MNKEIFNGFPQYIRITICAQIKKLLSTPYFGYDDREDIAQDMLCHYLYKFYEIPDVDEALPLFLTLHPISAPFRPVPAGKLPPVSCPPVPGQWPV